MSHVHWWLFGLSFAMGFVLTCASMARPRQREAQGSTAADPPTTKIVADPPTTKIVADQLTTKIPVGKEFPTTKIRVAKESPTTKIPVSPLAPYGPGSANPSPGGSGPPGWLVKGRMDTQVYYTPDDPSYDATVAQVWFIDEDSAAAARFTPWRQR
jgi:uncharacterized membrane protein ArfC